MMQMQFLAVHVSLASPSSARTDTEFETVQLTLEFLLIEFYAVCWWRLGGGGGGGCPAWG